jgi:hypothetical protein
VTRITFLSGAIFDDTELGVTTVSASGGLNLVAKIKKDSNRKATSHIAVMSMFVLLRGIFALGIVNYLINTQILFYYQNKIQNCLNSTNLAQLSTSPEALRSAAAAYAAYTGLIFAPFGRP